MRHPALRWARRGVVILVLFAVLDYLVLPQIAGTGQAVALLGRIRPWWVVIGIALEGLSLASYSLLTRSVLTDVRPSYSWLFRSDLTALGVSHLLPGGTATSTALRYRLLRAGGAPPRDVGVGMAVQGIGSNLVLASIAWVALVASVPFVGLHSLYAVAAAIGGVLIAAAVAGAVLRSRQPPTVRQGDNLGWIIARLPARLRPRAERAARASAGQLRKVLADKQGLRASASWSAGNWLLDAASLWVFLLAYGARVNPVGLLVAYGIANLVAIVPISPGGLGIVEAVVIPSLVGFGTPTKTAVLAVITWRLFNFWAPIPVSGGCYISLRAHGWRRSRAAGSAAEEASADRAVPDRTTPGQDALPIDLQ